MRTKQRSARVVAASVVLAFGAALAGIGAAVAVSGDTPAPPSNPGQSANEHGKHLGWAKVIDNDSQGKHLGWGVHGQHGGVPDLQESHAPGKSGEAHGKSDETHGEADEPHGDAGEHEQHGKAGQRP